MAKSSAVGTGKGDLAVLLALEVDYGSCGVVLNGISVAFAGHAEAFEAIDGHPLGTGIKSIASFRIDVYYSGSDLYILGRRGARINGIDIIAGFSIIGCLERIHIDIGTGFTDGGVDVAGTMRDEVERAGLGHAVFIETAVDLGIDEAMLVGRAFDGDGGTFSYGDLAGNRLIRLKSGGFTFIKFQLAVGQSAGKGGKLHVAVFIGDGDGVVAEGLYISFVLDVTDGNVAELVVEGFFAFIERLEGDAVDSSLKFLGGVGVAKGDAAAGLDLHVVDGGIAAADENGRGIVEVLASFAEVDFRISDRYGLPVGNVHAFEQLAVVEGNGVDVVIRADGNANMTPVVRRRLAALFGGLVVDGDVLEGYVRVLIATLEGRIVVRVDRNLAVARIVGRTLNDDSARGSAVQGDIVIEITSAIRGTVYSVISDIAMDGVGDAFAECGAVCHDSVRRFMERGKLTAEPADGDIATSRFSHTRAAHDQHGGHGERAESIDEVTLLQHRFITVDEIAYCAFSQHKHFSCLPRWKISIWNCSLNK